MTREGSEASWTFSERNSPERRLRICQQSREKLCGLSGSDLDQQGQTIVPGESHGRVALEWRAGNYLDFWWWFRKPKMKSMSGQPDITYARTMLNTNCLGNILVVGFKEKDNEPKFLFSTAPRMKAKTIRRIARLRWGIERCFWTLKQDLGFEDIHNGRKEAFVVRVTMLAVLYQALLDASRREKKTPTQFIRVFRGQALIVFQEIISGSAFSDIEPANPVQEVPHAA